MLLPLARYCNVSSPFIIGGISVLKTVSCLCTLDRTMCSSSSNSAMAMLVEFLYDALPLSASSLKRVAKAPSSTSIYPLFCLYRLIFPLTLCKQLTINHTAYKCKNAVHTNTNSSSWGLFNFNCLVRLHSSFVHMWSTSWRHVQCNLLVSPLKCPNVTPALKLTSVTHSLKIW